MKSILFEVDTTSLQCSNNINCETKKEFPYTVSIDLPLLPAFSIEYFSVIFNNETNHNSKEDKIVGSKLILSSQYQIFEWDRINVILYYHGIRDYKLLFPRVRDEELQKRIGQFYEEAEKNFEQGAWLSFALMCGAVFEGMLFSELNPKSSENSFASMIIVAYDTGVIDDNQRGIMETIRKSRNLVHANKVGKAYVSRIDAMDIRATLDKLIKDFSF